MSSLSSLLLLIAAIALLAPSTSAQVNVTEGVCLSIVGISASTPFTLQYRFNLVYQQNPNTAGNYTHVQLYGNRHLATATSPAGSDVAINGVAATYSEGVNWTMQGSSAFVSPYTVYLIDSLTDATSLTCPYPYICQTSRQFTVASTIPTVAGGQSSNAALTLTQLQVASTPSTTFFQEGTDTLGSSFAILSSTIPSVPTVGSYSAPNASVPLPTCATPTMPVTSAIYMCYTLYDQASTYGPWSTYVSALVSVITNVNTFNPAAPYANFNNTGEATELATSTAYAAQDITGLFTFNTYVSPFVTNSTMQQITGFYYSPMVGANPNYPTSSITQPFYYYNAGGYVLDTYGWQLQLNASTYFPDSTPSSTVRLGYFQDTQQWFAAYRADQQVAFGSTLTSAYASASAYNFSPYVNRGVQTACGSIPQYTPTRFVGPDNPTTLLDPTSVRVGLWTAAQNYSAVRALPTYTNNAGALVMQLVTAQQGMTISALGIVSTSIERMVRMALYRLSSGSFPSTGQWALVGETTSITQIPTGLNTYSPYTIEIPLITPVTVTAGQQLAVVVFRYGQTLIMPGLVQASTGANRSTLLPAQFIDVGAYAARQFTNTLFTNFTTLLPVITAPQLFAVGLDNTQVAAFAVGQVADGSSYVDSYAAVTLSAAYIPRPGSSSSSSTARSMTSPANVTVISPLVAIQTVQYISNEDNTWSGGNIAALVVALVIAGLVLCLLFFIAVKLAFSSGKAWPQQDRLGQYNVVPVTAPAGVKAHPAPLSPASGAGRDPYGEVEMPMKQQPSVPIPPRPAVNREEEPQVV